MNHRSVITAGQLFVMLFISRVSLSVIYSSELSGIESLWGFVVPILLSVPVMLLMLAPLLVMYRQNRGKSVCEAAGFFVPALYALWFLYDGLYVIYTAVRFLQNSLSEAASLLVICGLVIGCIYAAVRGIEATARMSALVLALLLLGTALLFVFLMQSYSSDNLLPVSYQSVTDTASSGAFLLSQMTPLVSLAVLAPKAKGRLFGAAVMWSVCTALLMLFAIVLFTGSIGEYLHTKPLQVYSAIDGSGSLQRLNPFFMLITACAVFCNLSVSLLSFAECARCISKKSDVRVPVALSVIPLLLFVLVFAGNDSIKGIFNPILRLILLFVLVSVIPLAILIFRAVRRFAGKTVPRKKMLKTVSLLLTLALSAVMLSGCRSTQLDKRLIVQGIGIDADNEGCQLTLIALDTENETAENMVKMVYADGSDTHDALNSLENRLGKELLFSQCLFIMMNTAAADRYHDTLSYFTDRNDIQKTVSLMCTPSSCEKVLTDAITSLGYRSEYINVLTDSRAMNQTAAHCTLLNAIVARSTPSDCLLLPEVAVESDIAALQVAGSYLIDGSGTGEALDENESLAVLMLKEHLTDFIYYAPDGQAIQVTDASAEILPQLADDGALALSIHISAAVSSEYSDSDKSTLAQSVAQRTGRVFDKIVVSRGDDLFGLYKSVRNVYPDYYRSVTTWNEALHQMRIAVSVAVE